MRNYQTGVKAYVNLDNLKENIKIIRSRLKADTAITAVVKADAYGHGAVRVARAALSAGAAMLAVATVDEGVELRKADITSPILVLSRGGKFEKAVEYNLTETVFDEKETEELNEEAKKQNKTVTVHIKLNTGMSRLGFDAFSENTADTIERISRFSNIRIEGIYSHFAEADMITGGEFTKAQYERFINMVGLLEEKGLSFKYKHICNSGGVFSHPDMQLNMVRPGIALYGCNPNDSGNDYGLKSIMEFKTSIIAVRNLKKGETVSYGRHYKAGTDRRVAVVGAGYADGYNRRLSNKAEVIICGKRAKVLGNICMDLFMADITDIPDACTGSEVVLIGRGGKEIITADELAGVSGTISYEILTSITSRVEREYLG